MDKNSLIKLFVIAIVVVFVFELIAIYGLNRSTNNETGDSRYVEKNYEGIIRGRLILNSYEPVLRVLHRGGNEIELLAKKLKEEGIVTYYLNPKEGVLLLNLKDANDIGAVAKRFKELNASSYSRAFFSLLKTNLTVEGVGDIPVASSTIRDEIEPRFEVGEEVLGQFPARISGTEGKEFFIVAWGSITFLPKTFENQSARIRILETSQKRIELIIPWEKRDLDIEKIKAKFDRGVEYSARSFVIFENEIGPEVQGRIVEKKLDYITAVYADTLSVYENFTDKRRIVEDLDGIALSFPNSTVTLTLNGTENVNLTDIKKKFEDVAGIDSVNSVKEYSLVKIKLPASIEVEGRNYSVSETEGALFLEGEYSAGEEMDIFIDGSTLGSYVYSLGYLRKKR